MIVDANISDLFFNTEHNYDKESGDYPDITTEADYFLDCLKALGVSIPSRDDLIQDFYNRL